MVVLRNGPRGAQLAPFGLAALLFLLMSTTVGFQDLGALIAQRPDVSVRGRQHLIASPFGTIHAATFTLPQPIGTAMPEPTAIHLASLQGRDADITGSFPVG